MRYYPFGETRVSTGTLPTDRLFTGQRELAELGIYHYGARFYSPTLGRFLSADSIVPDWTDPQALNRYSYVLNNPTRFTDPTGNYPCDAYCQAWEKAYRDNHPTHGNGNHDTPEADRARRIAEHVASAVTSGGEGDNWSSDSAIGYAVNPYIPNGGNVVSGYIFIGEHSYSYTVGGFGTTSEVSIFGPGGSLVATSSAGVIDLPAPGLGKDEKDLIEALLAWLVVLANIGAAENIDTDDDKPRPAVIVQLQGDTRPIGGRPPNFLDSEPLVDYGGGVSAGQVQEALYILYLKHQNLIGSDRAFGKAATNAMVQASLFAGRCAASGGCQPGNYPHYFDRANYGDWRWDIVILYGTQITH